MGITINRTSRELTNVEKYLMTTSPAVKKISDLENGTTIVVDAYLEFTDEKEDGTSVDIFSIITPDKQVFATNSKTFKRAFLDIETAMEGVYPVPILKTSGTSKAGREFVQCELDVANL